MAWMFVSNVKIIYGVAVSKYPGAGVDWGLKMGVESCGGANDGEIRNYCEGTTQRADRESVQGARVTT